MSATVRRNPCPSCPYRLDCPSGVWAPEEYAKLRQYDGDIVEQIASPGSVRPFLCHTTPAKLCAGWVGHRGPADLLAVRVGVSDGQVDPAVFEYRTDVPLFPSGAEAEAHGLRDIEAPGPDAVAVMGKVQRRRPDVE